MPTAGSDLLLSKGTGKHTDNKKRGTKYTHHTSNMVIARLGSSALSSRTGINSGGITADGFKDGLTAWGGFPVATIDWL